MKHETILTVVNLFPCHSFAVLDLVPELCEAKDGSQSVWVGMSQSYLVLSLTSLLNMDTHDTKHMISLSLKKKNCYLQI